MYKKLKILSVFLSILWAIGFFYFDFGPLIHLVLILATLLLILAVLKEKNY